MVWLTKHMYNVIKIFCLVCICIIVQSAVAQNEHFQNGYPIHPGVVLINSSKDIVGFFPTYGHPTDVALLPKGNEFAIVNLEGRLDIYQGSGELVGAYQFDDLWDVDAIDDHVFLLTSRRANRVFFFDQRTGEQRVLPFSLSGPVDTDLLPNENFLVCDADGSRVVELTPSGEVVWEYASELTQPMDALRLPNGNTLISDFDNHRLIEVASNGQIVNTVRGFDHPFKLTQLPNQEILIADSDKRRVVKLNSRGQIELIRDQMNYVKSTAYIPAPENIIMAVVENRYPPPETLQQEIPSTVGSSNEQAAQTPRTTTPLSSTVQSTESSQSIFTLLGKLLSPIMLLIYGVIAWALSTFMVRSRVIQFYLIMAAYSLVIMVAYHSITLAASTAPYSPSPNFFLAALLLAVFSFSSAKAFLYARENWIEPQDKPFCYPLSWQRTLVIITLTVLSIVLQYQHLKHGVQSLPWYLPMMTWGIGLVILVRGMFSAESFKPPMIRGLPLSFGSVGSDYDDPHATDYQVSYNLSQAKANKLVLMIMGLAAALYTIGATHVPTDFHGDEAEVALHGMMVFNSGNWNFFNLGWYSIPHLFYLIPAWVMWLFGENIFGIRMAGALTGLASIPFFYILARRLIGISPAVIATFLFATSSYFVHFSRIGIGYNQTTVLTLLGLYCFVRMVQDKDPRFGVLSGIVAGIGLLSYQATHLLLPLMLGSVGVLWLIRVMTLKKSLLMVLVIILGYWAAMSPLMGNYIKDPQASVSRANSISMLSEEGRARIMSEFPSVKNLNALVQKQLEQSFLAPITYEDRSPYLVNAQQGGMLDPIPGILFMAGCFLMITRLLNPTAALLLFWTVVTIVAGSVLTNRAPSYQRLIGLIPFLLLIAAPILNGCLQQIFNLGRWRADTRSILVTVVLLVILVLGMNRYFHQIQGKPQMLDEWTRIARYLDDSAPTHYTYFFGPPYVWFEYGTIRFLAPEAKGQNVADPIQFLRQKVQRRGPVTFLLVRGNMRYLDQLRALYPNGKEEHWFNSDNAAPFITYTVNL